MDKSRSKYFDISAEDLTEQQAIEELADLAKLIAYHDRLYEEARPVILDAEYDELTKRNEDIEGRFPQLVRPDSPSKRVGYVPSSGLKTFRHSVPMLSLKFVYTFDKVAEFIESIRTFIKELRDSSSELEIIAEPKVDGVSCSLRYRNHTLIRALTRGDGQMGEDVTPNVMTIADVPKTLPPHSPTLMEIRGEVYMADRDFLDLNERQKRSGEELFANPRNAASGSLRQLDPNTTASRALSFFAYTWGQVSGPFAKTQSEARDLFRSWGFKLNEPSRLVKNLEEIEAYFEDVEVKRSGLGFSIDGVVYKVNRLDVQERLGFISRSPRWAIAQKFSPERARTHIKGISISVGRTGALTPIAELEPVNVGGVLVARATLHNQDEIERKDFRIGDLVVVQRAGDVIPQLVSVVIEERPGSAESFRFPPDCPACKISASRELGEAAWFCTSSLTCPAQSLEQLKHFTSRNAFDIEGLGKKNIETFYNKGLLRSAADIFHLEEKLGSSASFDSRKETGSVLPLEEWEGWGPTSANKLFEAIRRRKRISLDRFLYSLGIKEVGEATARLLARNYISLSNLLKAIDSAQNDKSDEYNHLKSIGGIGPLVADKILKFFANPQNKSIVNEIRSEVEITDYEPSTARSPLAGKIIVFTGSLETMTRNEAKAKAEASGAIVAADVSNKTDYVVTGAGAGSKAQKAEKLGVEIISENEWLSLMQNG
jgi:DNA ligase (NAD+)